MLEILAIWFLMSRVGKMCKAKGRKAGWYKTLAVVLWFVGEGVGIAVAFMTEAPGTTGVVYLYAIIGALVGGGLALFIVYRLESRTPTNINFPASLGG